MKTNLPESRNRNLPPPPAAAAEVRARRFTEPQEKPRRGPLRSFLAMLVVGGLLAAGIWYYIRGAESDVEVRERIEASLKAVAVDLWSTGMSFSLSADTDEASADLADLPRVVMAVRAAARKVLPEIRVIEGDPPPGNGRASHQILFYVQDLAVLVIRVWYERDTGRFKFIGEKNRVVPSRKDLKDGSAPPQLSDRLPPGAPPSAATPAPSSAPLPAPSGTPQPAPVPTPAVSPESPPPGSPAEKVSEQP